MKKKKSGKSPQQQEIVPFSTFFSMRVCNLHKDEQMAQIFKLIVWKKIYEMYSKEKLVPLNRQHTIKCNMFGVTLCSFREQSSSKLPSNRAWRAHAQEIKH